MRRIRPQQTWKQWLKISRLVPLMTAVVAGGVGILALLGRFQASLAEGIIITILALLAIDALTERLSLLEKIESRILSYASTECLKDRSQLPHPQDLARTASEIAVVAVSAISLVNPHLGFFEQKIREGCKLRFVLLDTTSESLRTWNLLTKLTTTESDIKATLEALKLLMQMDKRGFKGKCEVRLAKTFLPFSMVIADPSKVSGSMVIEFYTYKTTLGERPHVQLTRSSDHYWFDFFRAQFEQIWSEADEWSPPL